MKFTRGRLALGLVLAACLALAAFAGFKARALLRSTAQFRAWPSDPRVRYEPGAEALAQEVATALPTAIRAVEQRQYRAFLEPPTVYVCASIASYASYGADARSGGHVINRRLFISPKKANAPERVPRVLAHELSHLHIEQQVGTLRWIRAYPPWFQEGLAALVSDGGGAEGVSVDDVRRALAAGRALVPETTSGLFHRKTANSYGLDAHLFYREAELFLASVRERDASKFRRFLLAVEDGEALESAFEAAFSETLATAWGRFVTSVEGSR